VSESWSNFFAAALNQFDALALRRRRTVANDASLIDFGSNDYLGLRRHPLLVKAVQDALTLGVWGSGASPVVSGYSQLQSQLEAALAEFSDQPAAMVFSSGYATNAGTIACLGQKDDLILSDQLNHASLIDGCRLSAATRIVYTHGSLDEVRENLRAQRHCFKRALIVTESIFSMDGDSAPLKELGELARSYDCGLVIDEAHAVGIYGERGSGLVEHLGLDLPMLLKLGTLSKSLGSMGGYACGESTCIEYLVNRCRSYMFSTSPPPAMFAAPLAALELAQGMEEARSRLRRTGQSLRSRISQLGLKVPLGDSPIVPVVVGTSEQALAIQQSLRQRGYYVPAIRPPTVPAGTARLRISLSILHTPEHVDGLVEALSAAI
jgi:8-amino-7-oxononanoate synthase